MSFVRTILPAAAISCVVGIAAVCNGSYTSAPYRLPTALHPVTPSFSSVYHGEQYRFPVNACDQPQCHGPDLTGGNSGAPSCYKCHGNRWNVFITHTLNISGYYHNPLVDTVLLRSELFSLCGDAGCHGPDLKGVTGAGKNCFSCHDPIPMPGHRVDYSGRWHKIGVQDGGANTSCAQAGCHGDPGHLGPYCSSCHAADTHTLSIGGAKHNPVVDTATWASDLPALCGNSWCHGSALTGGTGRAVSCFQCHNPVPTPGHRVNSGGVWHRIGVVEGGANTSCSVSGCHGDPLRKGPLCTQCHDTSSGG